MAYEQKPNTGVLFTAEKKSEKHPDLNGSLKLEDEEYYISAWKKTGPKGEYLSLSVKKKEEYLSLSIKKKESQTQQVEQPKYKVTQNDLPF